MKISSDCLSRFFCALLATAFLCFPIPSHSADLFPEKFVDIQKFIPGVVADIRYFTPHNFVGEPIDGYKSPKCLITVQAARALRKVQDDLEPFSLSLKIYDCYRPQRAVNHFVRWAGDIRDTRTKTEFYPTIDKTRLFADGYIAERSGHSRGSTVDLTIVPLPVPAQEAFRPGQELFPCFLPAAQRFRDNSIDMGTGFDCFHTLSHTASPDIDAKQRANRAMLKKLMEKHGFVSYDKEWWHFTLKNEPFPDTYFDFVIE
ncbi:MAG: M15 family metallopeptidase [Syntrophorhabdaceae bacterium]